MQRSTYASNNSANTVILCYNRIGWSVCLCVCITCLCVHFLDRAVNNPKKDFVRHFATSKKKYMQLIIDLLVNLLGLRGIISDVVLDIFSIRQRGQSSK